MQTFAAHLKEKLQDERFRKMYEEERQLAELSLQLVAARDKSGKSQKDVAQQAQVTQQQLSRLENGASCNVTTLLNSVQGLFVIATLNPKYRSCTVLIHTLKKALMQGSVSLTRHRMDLISGLVCALMQVRSVNLRKLACSLPGMAQIDSQYRRLQRFFSSAFSPAVFTELIVSKLVRPGQPQVLVMDRTHWKLGRTDLNLLCVGLVYQGVSIPLAYQSLQKPGNSHTDERKHLLTQVWAYLDARVCCLVADREFIGRDWFAFLLEQSVEIVIRLRGNTATLDDGRRRYAATFNERMPRNTTRYYPQTTLYNGLTLHLVCHRPARGERILLITNRTDLKQVLAVYGQRWAIETTFACLKSRGFNLEDTHMTHPQRIHLLLGLLAWTLLWALLMGEQLHQRKPSPLKKHGRPAISLFRRGLDQLTQIIHQVREQPKHAQQYQPILLSCT